MNLPYVKGTIAMPWACSVLTLGLLAHTTSPTGWVTLAIAGIALGASVTLAGPRTCRITVPTCPVTR